jgi:hypothetical protein
VFHRDRLGKAVKGTRVRDRQAAERELRKVQVGIDEGNLGQAKRPDKTFRDWSEEYLEIIVARGRKIATVRSYRPTLNIAYGVFGDLVLREIGNPELRQLVAKAREKGGDATISKHLRQVSAIFQAAVDDDLIAAPRAAVQEGVAVPRGRRGRVIHRRGTGPAVDVDAAREGRRRLRRNLQGRSHDWRPAG